MKRGWFVVEDGDGAHKMGVRVDAVEAFGVDDDGVAWAATADDTYRLGRMTFEELRDHLGVDEDNAAAERGRPGRARRPPRGARPSGTRPGARGAGPSSPGIRPAGSGARPGPRPTAPAAVSAGPGAGPGPGRRPRGAPGSGVGVRRGGEPWAIVAVWSCGRGRSGAPVSPMAAWSWSSAAAATPTSAGFPNPENDADDMAVALRRLGFGRPSWTPTRWYEMDGVNTRSR